MSEPIVEGPSEDEAYRDQMRDPDVRQRLRDIFDEAERPSDDPGVTEEQLPGFLRELG